MDLKSQINITRLPEHIAIIMDGNGRWAKKHGRPRVFGHKNGVKAVREATEAAAELGVKHLTLYAFSTENWNRPSFEINALMTLLVQTLKREIKTLNKNDIRLNAIGALDHLPGDCHNQLKECIKNTAQNSRMTLTLALSYSSRWEITDSIKKIARAVKEGTLDPESIDESIVQNHLSTHNIPDPELLIRTSGETRISNFLLWQIAYSELYFTPIYWPDFTKDSLYEAIIDYQNRERRFGKISEQLTGDS